MATLTPPPEPAVSSGPESPERPVRPAPARRSYSPPPRLSRFLESPIRPHWWTIALAAALLVAAGGIGLLWADDSNFQRSAGELSSQNRQLKSENDTLRSQLNTTQTNLTATLGELATVRAQLDHPTVVTWTVAQTLRNPDSYLMSGIPDAFTFHLSLAANHPISVSILTHEDLAAGFACFNNGVGNVNWCMHHSGTPVRSWLNTQKVEYDFHDAEGCADYVVIITAASSATVTPNVSVTYNPNPNRTGVCI